MLSLQTVLFATDGSATAEAARAVADRLAARHGAQLHVLRVEIVLPGDAFRPRPEPEPPAGPGITVTRRAPTADAAIVAYAAEVGADLVVLGTHGRGGLDRIALGSTAEGVLRRSPCPVLTVGPNADADADGPVLAPLAFESSSDVAFEAAVAVARSRGVGVVALHVVEPVTIPAPYAVAFDPLTQPGVRDAARATLERWTGAVGPTVPITAEIRGGRAAPAIVAAAAEHGAGVVVQASHGRRGLSRWLLGSVAEEVVRHAPCPVLTLRAEARPPWSARDGRAAIARADWPALFDALSARAAQAPHAVTVEVLSPEAEGPVFREAALLGLTYDPHDDAVEVVLEGGGAHVVRPFAVRADAGPWLLDGALDPASPGPFEFEVVRTDGGRERITVGALQTA